RDFHVTGVQTCALPISGKAAITMPGEPAVNDAERHLAAVCQRFARVVPGHEPYPTRFEKNRDPYRALVRAVVFQQLSGKAAATRSEERRVGKGGRGGAS